MKSTHQIEVEASDPFHLEILNWDPLTLKPKVDPKSASAVPTIFVDETNYRETFLPLLYEEVRAQCLASAGSEDMDAFVVQGRITKTYQKQDNLFLFCRFETKKRANWKHLDLVRLTNKDVTILGVVTGTYSEVEIKIDRVHTLMADQEWSMAPVGNLITSTRHFTALSKFCIPSFSFPLKKYVLDPKTKAVFKKDWNRQLSKEFYAWIESTSNPSQLEAIKAGLGLLEGFCLVQGPPGTGKTFTSIKMLNALHLQLKMDYYGDFVNEDNYIGIKPPAPPPKVVVTPKGPPVDFLDEILVGMSQLSTNERKPILIQPQWNPKDIHTRPRILVCASSNAAVDEIMQRIIKIGFMDNRKNVYKPNVIRIGNSEKTSQDCQVVQLDAVVTHFLNSDFNKKLTQIETEKQKVQSQMKTTLASLVGTPFKTNVAAQFGKLKREWDSLSLKGERYKSVKNFTASASTYPRDPQSQKKLEQLTNNFKRDLASHILRDADIVFTTLSGSGMSHLYDSQFDIVFLDEAAQSVELDTLVSLQHRYIQPIQSHNRCSRCIMVGDPCQLPATVISLSNQHLNYSQSLFSRLSTAVTPHLLNVQYRMHPQISIFPNTHFYDSKLQDGSNTLAYKPPFYESGDAFMKPFLFFDVEGRESTQQGQTSYTNKVEADFIFHALYPALLNNSKDPNVKKYSIGVITPYRRQQQYLKELFQPFTQVEVNTIDAFQGREKDIIIISCVRTSSNHIGFLADTRRMNVAITRPKYALWIVGNSARLSSNPTWMALITHAKQTKAYQPVIKEQKKATDKQSITNDEGKDDEAKQLEDMIKSIKI